MADLRDRMPKVAAFIDEMREVFGIEEVNALVRRGMRGEPTFWAGEGGIEIGTKSNDDPAKMASPTIVKLVEIAKGRKR